jgi:hypothetical protein
MNETHEKRYHYVLTQTMQTHTFALERTPSVQSHPSCVHYFAHHPTHNGGGCTQWCDDASIHVCLHHMHSYIHLASDTTMHVQVFNVS